MDNPYLVLIAADEEARRVYGDQAYFRLDGDLCQMAAMARTLRAAGFAVVNSGVFPGFARDDEEGYVRALRHLFEHRVEGWWNQKRDLVKYGVCTQEEFDRALGRRRLPTYEELLTEAEAALADRALLWTPQFGAWAKVRALLLFRRGRFGPVFSRCLAEVEEVLGRAVREDAARLSNAQHPPSLPAREPRLLKP